tara:strand:- start:3217 stop:3948 length:732 start_codon:yes stop_codon:yes gene_type:complete
MFLDISQIKDIIRKEYKDDEYFTSINSNEHSLNGVLDKSEDIILDSIPEGKTCAIVGSSPNVFENENGDFIDEHDCVVRFNLARTEGYEKSVGSKTDFRIISTKSFGYTEIKDYEKHDFNFFKELSNQHFLIKPRVDRNFRHFAGGFVNNMDTNNKVSVISVEYMNSVSGLFKKMVEPSCGLLGISIMLQHYDKINLFGFDFYQDFNKLHYFENVQYFEKVHNFNEEREYCKTLEKLGRIKIY